MNAALIDLRLRQLASDELFFETMSVQQMSNEFCETLTYVNDRYFQKEVICGRLKLPHKLSKLFWLKNRLLRFHKKNKDLLVKEIFKKVKSEFDYELKKFVSKREIDLFSKDSKKFWKCINSRLKYHSGVPSLETDQGLVSTTEEKCKALLEQYDKVFVDDNGLGIPPMVRCQNQLITCTFDARQIFEIIRRIEGKSSSGYDSISSKLLKTLALPASHYLAHLFTKSMQTSTIPEEWLLSVITPVPKKSNPIKPPDFRPVSMTCIACRIMEKIILNQIVNHFERENLFSKNQHGFLKKRSTVTCLMECFADWSDCFENKYSIDVLYIDISKAFDSISHKKLLLQLENFGIRGLLLKWIENWLTNRKQAVKVDNKLSDFKRVRSGVPQGSVLGPLLFCIYMSGLDSVLEHCRVKYYADDAKMYGRVSTPEEGRIFQDETNRLQKWSDEFQLKIAFEKCAILQLNPQYSLKYQYTMNNLQLTTCNQIRDLGVIIDENLNFSVHIDTVARKAGLVSNIIFHNFKCRDVRFLAMAYAAYVRPILEYANESFFPKYKKDLCKLENVQRSYTRRIPALREMTYRQRLSKMGLETLELRRIKSGLIFIFKYLNNYVSLENNRLISRSTTSRSTRSHKYAIHIPINKSMQKDQMISKLATIWNSLRSDVVESYSVQSFKNKLDKIDLSRYCQYSVN